MFAFQGSAGDVAVAFTDRHGGVSAGPYSSLNLGYGVGDDPAAVDRNLQLVGEEFARLGAASELPGGPPALVTMSQVHGAHVAVVDGSSTTVPTADALVTDMPGVTLVVRVADCVPVLLADTAGTLVAAVHAGRPGLMAGVVPATLAELRRRGAGQLQAWIGPHVCGRCYEVPAPMRGEVATRVPEAYAETSWGTPSVDVGAGVIAQLRADDVEVHDVSTCTRESDGLFSYRRQGRFSGRLAGLVRIAR